MSLSTAQYGGVKGTSTDHFLIDSWQNILSTLEDPNAAASICSIDFEKAFNRMSHSECLSALERYGAGTLASRMVPALLYRRKMTVKVGTDFSAPRPVNGGSPQGSLLGNFLFCLTTDCFPRLCENDVDVDVGVEGAVGMEDVGVGGAVGMEEHQAEVVVTPTDSCSSDDEIRRARPRRRMPWNSSDSEEETAISSQYQINAFFPKPNGWEEKRLFDCVYIDDFNTIEKTLIKKSPVHISSSKQRVLVHAPKSELRFKQLNNKAAEIGMRINCKKTQMLCITGRLDSKIDSYIYDGTNRIESSDTLKILGFTFGRSPGPEEHVKKIEEKFRAKIWSIRFLKKAKLPLSDITDLYCTVFRPSIDYCVPTYHSMLTNEQSDRLERLQSRALKSIYGWNKSYETVLELSGLDTLKERREKLVDSFAQKTSRNPRYNDTWFPKLEQTEHDTRNKLTYREEYARTERYKNSPVFYMRRRLNLL